MKILSYILFFCFGLLTLSAQDETITYDIVSNGDGTFTINFTINGGYPPYELILEDGQDFSQTINIPENTGSIPVNQIGDFTVTVFDPIRCKTELTIINSK